jgi:NAD(P)-dependent dehydrogenase (short-subunit alcohol dehydrogenase family)
MNNKEYYGGKVCAITGAASGIGYALTQALLDMGAVVSMADRDSKGLSAAVEKLARHKDRVQCTTVDVTQQDQVKRWIDDTAAQRGSLDFLFNNAGVGCTLPIGTATMEHWRRVIDVNLWGVIYGTDAAIPIMRRQKSGHVICTASLAGLIPFPFQAIYAAAKYGVVGMSECFRLELADEGIHFSVVCPGDVATPIYGTPVFGERVDVKPPDHAIPVDQAVQEILAGVAKKQGIIVLPEISRELWHAYRTAPEAVDALLLDMARKRRESYETDGGYY